MVNPNLLVTYDPAHRVSAREEVERLIGAKKKSEVKFFDSKINGLFEVRVKNPRELVKKLRNLGNKSPEKFSKTYRWVPVDKWCKAGVKEMQAEVKKFAKDIKKTETWRMELNKRRHKGDSIALILKLTDVIDRPNVSLKNPKKIVSVEIVGNRAGLSLLKDVERFNIQQLKKE